MQIIGRADKIGVQQHSVDKRKDDDGREGEEKNKGAKNEKKTSRTRPLR